MTNELNEDWLAVVWNRGLGVLWGKLGLLVLDVFNRCLTPEIKATISSRNTDLLVLPSGMTAGVRC
jgi:hypothetical protein